MGKDFVTLPLQGSIETKLPHTLGAFGTSRDPERLQVPGRHDMLGAATDPVVVHHLQGRWIDDIDVVGIDVRDVDAFGHAHDGLAEVPGRRIRIDVHGLKGDLPRLPPLPEVGRCIGLRCRPGDEARPRGRGQDEGAQARAPVRFSMRNARSRCEALPRRDHDGGEPRRAMVAALMAGFRRRRP